MSESPARAALAEALRDWRRHAVAAGIALAAIGVAALLGSGVAFYAAALIAFSVWMVWFVLTAIEWVRRADF